MGSVVALWKDSASLRSPLPTSLTAAAAMLPPPSEQALSELLARKEEEWRALQAHRAQLQEAALQDAQRRLEEAEGRLRRLQEDFVYNLQLLEERDRELERYDAAFAQAQRLQEARQAEASELKIEAAKLRQALAREARRREDLQQQHQLKLQEHRLALERVHRWDTCASLTRRPVSGCRACAVGAGPIPPTGTALATPPHLTGSSLSRSGQRLHHCSP